MWKSLITLLFALGCESAAPALHEPCALGVEPSDPTAIAAEYPNLTCETHICLRTPDSGATCTTSCFADDDCAQGDPSCAGGFACEVATVEGEACCLRMCVCRDDRALLPAADQVAASCTVSSSSTCRNLPGRH